MAIKITDENGSVIDEDVLRKVENKEKVVVVSKPIPKTAKVYIPVSLIYAMQTIGAIKSLDKMEYALLYKVEAIDKLTYRIIDNDFICPKQEVTETTVRILTDKMTVKELDIYHTYNGVVHRHPNGVERFSVTDDVNLNKLFQVSLLFLKDYKIPKCIVNVALDAETMFQIDATMEVYGTFEGTFTMQFDGFTGKPIPYITPEHESAFLNNIEIKKYRDNNVGYTRSMFKNNNGTDEEFDELFDKIGTKAHLTQEELDDLLKRAEAEDLERKIDKANKPFRKPTRDDMILDAINQGGARFKSLPSNVCSKNKKRKAGKL